MNLNDHVLDDKLEAYLMGRLSAEEVDRVDDHILVCQACRSRFEETEGFLKAMRTAAERVRQEESFFRHRPRPWWHRGLQPVLARPGWAVAGVALIAIVFLLPVSRTAPVTFQEVALRATRGSGTETVSSDKNTRVRLRLDLAGIPLAGACRVTVVDSEGRAVWEATTSRQAGGEELVVNVEQRLNRGGYWVRIFDPSTNKLLREYQLRIS